MDKRIGAQLFTVREFLRSNEDFDNTCRIISDIGYKTVQVSGTPLDAKTIRKILGKYHMKALLAHLPFDKFTKKLDWVIDYNKTIGSDLCGLGMMPQEYMSSIDELKEFIKKANKICEVLKTENMYFGYHNHSIEFARIGGRTVFDILVSETDPEVFNFIVDTYWLAAAGIDAAKCIRKLGKRAMAVHFKDCKTDIDDWQHMKMCEVGEGNLDWDDIIAACEEAGTRWALVEQDTNWVPDNRFENGNPFKSLRKSYEFLTTKGFM